MAFKTDCYGNIQIELSQESKALIAEKILELEKSFITNELIEEIARELLRGVVKGRLGELFQSQEFRKKLYDKFEPVLLKIIGE